jgi:hemin uptake protein HemP
MPNTAAQVDREASKTAGPQEAAPRISSQQLLGQRREIVILHNGREYRLRETQNGKLILTA